MTEEASAEAVEQPQLCAYCKTQLHPGATVCHACGREQPDIIAKRKEKRESVLRVVLAFGITFLVIGVPLIWWGVNSYKESVVVNRIVECGHLHGDKTMNAEGVRADIDMGEEQTGKGFLAGTQYAALFYAKNGSPEIGACFITQETLFSD